MTTPRGRPPKPAAIRELEGNAGKRPIPEEVKPAPATDAQLEPPDWLDDYAREAWEALVPELERLGLLTSIDLLLFAASCESWSLYKRAALQMKRGITQRTRSNGTTPKAALTVRNAGLRDATAIWAAFGIGAVARARLGVTDAKKPDEEGNDFLARKPRRPA